MADTDIRVNEGTGPKIDMRSVGAGTDENRQVVVVGDPSAAAGVAPVDPTNGLAVQVKTLPTDSFGAPTDAAASGNGSLIAILKQIRSYLGSSGITVTRVNAFPNASSIVGAISFTAAAQTSAFTTDNLGTFGLQIIGTWVGTLVFEASMDGTNWVPVAGHNGTNGVTSTTINGLFFFNVPGFINFRIRSSAWTSGTATASLVFNNFPHPMLALPLPSGTNNIGDVDVLTVPADPLGANSDAAVHDATGSINAHLRGIAKGLGTNADAAVAAGAAGSIDALLRSISRDLVANIVLAAGSALVGDVGLQPRTTGGLTMYEAVSAASNNAASVKGSAGQVYSVNVTNNATGWRYLKFYNKASSPSPGSDTVVYVIGIPPGGGHAISFPQGLAFGTGIAIAIVTGISNTDNTSTGANEVVVSIGYK